MDICRRLCAVLLSLLVHGVFNVGHFQAGELPATKPGEINSFFVDCLAGNSDLPIDAEAALERIQSEQLLTPLDPTRRSGVLDVLASGLRNEWKRLCFAGDWKSAEVLIVRPDEQGRLLQVVVQMVSPGTEQRSRYLFFLNQKGDNQWKVVDWRLLDSALGLAVQKGILLAAIAGDTIALDAWQRLEQAHKAVNLGNDAEAAMLLRLSLDDRIPPSLKSSRWLLMADVFLRQGRSDLVTLCLDEVRWETDSLSVLPQLKAKNALLEERYKDAEIEARRCLQLGGPQAETLTTLGLAFLGQQNKDQAIETFQQSLEVDRNHHEALLQLAQALPLGRKAELRKAFLQLSDPQLDLPMLAESLLAVGDAASVEVIVQALAAVTPDTNQFQVYLGAAKLLRKQYEEAGKCFAVALNGRAAEDETYLLQRYSVAMMAAGAAPQALGILAQYLSNDEAFLLLADQMLELEDEGQLATLIAAADKVHPHCLALIQGELALRREDYASAAARFTESLEAMSKADPREDQATRGWRLARYGQGESLSAYQQSADKASAFEQLALRLASDKKGDALQQLVSAFRADFPESPMLETWDAEVLWQSEDYAACAALLLKHWDQVREDPVLLVRCEDRLVRSLVRTDQLKQAFSIAADSTDRDGDPWFEMVVQGVANNVPETERLLMQCLQLGYTLTEIQEDADLSSILNTEAFADVRQRLASLSAADTSK